MLRAPFPGCLQATNEQTLANPLLSENYDIMITSILYTVVVASASESFTNKALIDQSPLCRNATRTFHGKTESCRDGPRKLGKRPTDPARTSIRGRSHVGNSLKLVCFLSKRVARADQPVHFLDTIQSAFQSQAFWKLMPWPGSRFKSWATS